MELSKQKLFLPFIKLNITKHKKISFVLISNFIALGIGAILSFLIPYLLDVHQFGYYKQFTLYLSYVGLLHFGFNDGIYLKYGAYNYEDLDKFKFRMYFRYLLYQQLVTSVVLFLFIFLIFKGNRLFIFSFVIFNMILLNIAKYFSYISQITKRFILYSVSYLIEKTAIIIPIIFLYLVNLKTFQYVIISQTMVYAFLLLFLMIVYKDLIFGDRLKQSKKEILKILLLGYSLMLGNFIMIMIFTVDRIMIQFLLPIRDFSIYSLSIQFLSVILVFVSSISMMYYPYLKRKDSTSYKESYEKLGKIVSCFSIIALSSFFPIKYIIINYLPQYKESIPILLILLPGVCLRGEIEIVFNNLFKSLNKQKVYFMISIFVLCLSILLNIFLYYFYRNLYSITISSLLTFIIWYMISDYYLKRYFKIKNYKKYLFIIISYGNYYITSNYNNILLGCLFYLGMVVFFVLLTYFDKILKRRNA